MPLSPNYSKTLVKSLDLVFRLIFSEHKAVCSVNMHVTNGKDELSRMGWEVYAEGMAFSH